MKILFVIDTLYTSNNGTSISAQRYASELRKLGNEVRALCGDQPRTQEEAQITNGDFCTGIFRFPIFQPLCEKHDFRFANMDKPIIHAACKWADVVHVFTPFFMSNAAINYCNEIGKPVTAAFHIQPENITSSLGLGKEPVVNKLIYKIFRYTTYNRVRHVHVPSRFMEKMLKLNGYTAQIHTISNGVHEDFIEAGKAQEPSLQLSKSADGKFKIMMIGRLSREKRQDVIIKALQYSKYGDRIQLVFAGRGPEYKRYLKLSKGLANPPLFTFLSRSQLIEELLSTDLYVHASDMESEAISCIEAFATGLVPVIANSDNSATPQFALDERSLFKAGDPRDLARAIDYWLDRPKERLFMGAKYRESACKYSLSNCVKQFEQMLRLEASNGEMRYSKTA